MAKKSETQSETKSDEAKAEKGNDEVQRKVDIETDQGYRGVEVDPTPNEAYTVAGVTAGQATPETDAVAYDAAQAEVRGSGRRGDK